jgi:hypothetical protein
MKMEFKEGFAIVSNVIESYCFTLKFIIHFTYLFEFTTFKENFIDLMKVTE